MTGQKEKGMDRQSPKWGFGDFLYRGGLFQGSTTNEWRREEREEVTGVETLTVTKLPNWTTENI